MTDETRTWWVCEWCETTIHNRLEKAPNPHNIDGVVYHICNICHENLAKLVISKAVLVSLDVWNLRL